MIIIILKFNKKNKHFLHMQLINQCAPVFQFRLGHSQFRGKRFKTRRANSTKLIDHKINLNFKCGISAESNRRDG